MASPSLPLPNTRQKIPGTATGREKNTDCSERHPAVRGSHLHPQNNPVTWTTASRALLPLPCAHLSRQSSNAHSLRQPHSHIHSGSLPSRDGNTRALRAASPRRTCSDERLHGGGSPWRTPTVSAHRLFYLSVPPVIIEICLIVLLFKLNKKQLSSSVIKKTVIVTFYFKPLTTTFKCP